MSKRYLVFDVGATNTRLAIAWSDGRVEEPSIFATMAAANGPDHLLLEIRKKLAGSKVDGCAGGIASPINYETGKLINSPNLPMWNGVNLASLIGAEIDAPTKVENDTAMVGLGEAIDGAGRGHKYVAYLTFSTGINGVRIVNRRVDASHQGFQIGFQVIQMKAGTSASVEDLAGGRSLAVRYGKEPHALAATSVWPAVERAVIAAIYNSMLFWSPEVIVLGGGMMKDLKVERLRKGLSEMPAVFAQLPDLERAELGDVGGLHGALAWLKQG